MTYNKAREYLWSIKRLDMDINTKMQELEKLNEQATSLQSFQLTERVMTTHQNSANCVIDHIVDLQAEINKEADNLVDLKRIARAQIQQMNDERYRDLLLNYYINNKTWEEVAEIIRCDVRHVYRLNKKAIQKFIENVMVCHAETMV